MSALSKVTMTTLKIAAVGQLKLEVPKRGNGRPADELFFSKECVGPANEILREAILNKFFVLFPDNGLFSLRAPDENIWCRRGDLNPHGDRPPPPQDGVSTNSTTSARFLISIACHRRAGLSYFAGSGAGACG